VEKALLIDLHITVDLAMLFNDIEHGDITELPKASFSVQFLSHLRCGILYTPFACLLNLLNTTADFRYFMGILPTPDCTLRPGFNSL
jgi:hypothetical protein